MVEDVQWFEHQTGGRFRVGRIDEDAWAWSADLPNGGVWFLSDDGFTPRTYESQEAAKAAAIKHFDGQ